LTGIYRLLYLIIIPAEAIAESRNPFPSKKSTGCPEKIKISCRLQPSRKPETGNRTKNLTFRTATTSIVLLQKYRVIKLRQ